MNTKDIIIAKDKEHLMTLITNEIDSRGECCDLNHIDVSSITDMSFVFYKSQFNGDISNWNTSKVIDMSYMFSHSKFNGDLSDWPVSNILKVTDMIGMFHNCPAKQPWWYNEDNEQRKQTIDNYISKESLMNRLNEELTPSKKGNKFKI